MQDTSRGIRPSWCALATTLVAGLALAARPASAPATAWEETTVNVRQALVIGNSAYVNQSSLKNPANDASLIAKTLEERGFEVETVLDTDWQRMQLAIVEFGQRLQQTQGQGIGLFYYAGHGVQVHGENYMIPIGAPIRDESHVRVYAMSAERVLAEMESAGNRMNIIILDACRNNPYRGRFRSALNGLAQMSAPRGSLVAFSTAPGKVAADGAGANSPYALALTEAIQEPGLEVLDLFRTVSGVIERQTGEEQTPWFQTSVTGEFFFTQPEEPEEEVQLSRASGEPSQAAPALPAISGEHHKVLEKQAKVQEQQADVLFWQSIAESNDPALYEAYIREFPSGKFAAIAKIKRGTAKTRTATAGGSSSNMADSATQPSGKVKHSKGKRLAALPSATETPEPSAEPEPAKASPAPKPEPRDEVQLARADRREVQTMLNALGLSVGVADGLFGPKTRQQIARFQESRGSVASGYLTSEELAALREQAAQPLREARLAAARQATEKAQQQLESLGRGESATAMALPRPSRVAPGDVQDVVGVYRSESTTAPFRDCKECPEMIRIPKGTFTMGSDGRDPNERPARTVTVAKDFAIGAYEVTVGEWKACIASNEACSVPGEEGREVRGHAGKMVQWITERSVGQSAEGNAGERAPDPDDRMPVTRVRWDQAQEFLQWLSSKTGHTYRLASEAEWEYAARYGVEGMFLWKSRSESCRFANGKTVDACDDGSQYASEVGSYQPSVLGLYDMMGNVWEWVADCWHDNYRGAPDTAEVWGSGSCRYHVLRGGSFVNSPRLLRVTNRLRGSREGVSDNVGFRVVREIPDGS